MPSLTSTSAGVMLSRTGSLSQFPPPCGSAQRAQSFSSQPPLATAAPLTSPPLPPLPLPTPHVYPCFDEMSRLRLPAQHRVPKGLRGEHSAALAKMYAGVTSGDTPEVREKNILLLQMYPKCVLRPFARGGAKSFSANKEELRRRLAAWDDGRHIELWQEAVAAAAALSAKQRKQLNREAARDGLAIRLAQQGRAGKAAQVLMSGGLAPDSAETISALRGLHPPAPKPIGPPAPQVPAGTKKPSEFIKAQGVTLQKVLSSFDPNTACGPSGLRVQHLLDAMGSCG